MMLAPSTASTFIGVLICLVGMAVIMYVPRGTDPADAGALRNFQ